MPTYLTETNNPEDHLKVVVEGNSITAYKVLRSRDAPNGEDRLVYTYDPKPVYECKDATKIFIGKSTENAITKRSGIIGPKWDGNSILVRPSNEECEYIYLNSAADIRVLNTSYPLLVFFSAVGNDDEVYAWPLDLKNRIIYFEDFTLKGDKHKRIPESEYTWSTFGAAKDNG